MKHIFQIVGLLGFPHNPMILKKKTRSLLTSDGIDILRTDVTWPSPSLPRPPPGVAAGDGITHRSLNMAGERTEMSSHGRRNEGANGVCANRTGARKREADTPTRRNRDNVTLVGAGGGKKPDSKGSCTTSLTRNTQAGQIHGDGDAWSPGLGRKRGGRLYGDAHAPQLHCGGGRRTPNSLTGTEWHAENRGIFF